MKFVVKIKAEASVIFSDFSGYAIQGFFYNLLASENEKLAMALHNSGEPAPYSLTPVFEVGSGNPIFKYLSSNTQGAFSMTVLGDDLCKAITRGMLKKQFVELNGIRCKITDIEVLVIELANIWGGAVPVRKFSVDFLTPTKFTAPPRDISRLAGLNSGKVILAPHRNIYLPIPERLMVSILNFWKVYLQELFAISESQYREWLLAGGLVCSGYPGGIRTVLLRGGGASVGFCGKVYYAIPNDCLFSKNHAMITDALLRLGEIFNVGDERTAGLGVIRYERNEICS